MKHTLRLISLIFLALTVLAGGMPSALAGETAPVFRSARGLEVTLDGIRSVMTLNGEESPTHGWIILDVTFNNESFDTVDIGSVLGATVTYNGLYAYEAELAFDVSVFEPLVTLPGALVFRVPKRVANADREELSILLHADGESHTVFSGFGKTHAHASASFLNPEDAIQYLFERLADVDIDGAFRAFDHDDYASHSSFEKTITYNRRFNIETLSLPTYDSYHSLNALQQNPQKELRMFIFHTLADLGVDPKGGGMILNYIKNSSRRPVAWTQDGQEIEIDIQELEALLNPERLQALSLLEIHRSSYEPFSRRHQSYVTNAYFSGGTDRQEYLLIFSFEGVPYALGATLIRYPEGWKISALSSSASSDAVNQLRFCTPGLTAKLDESSFLDTSAFTLTWKNGSPLSGNLLIPALPREDFFGEWTHVSGSVTFSETGVSVSGDETAYDWIVSGEYLAFIAPGSRNVDFLYRYHMDGDLLMLSDEKSSWLLTKN